MTKARKIQILIHGTRIETPYDYLVLVSGEHEIEALNDILCCPVFIIIKTLNYSVLKYVRSIHVAGCLALAEFRFYWLPQEKPFNKRPL